MIGGLKVRDDGGDETPEPSRTIWPTDVRNPPSEQGVCRWEEDDSPYTRPMSSRGFEAPGHLELVDVEGVEVIGYRDGSRDR